MKISKKLTLIIVIAVAAIFLGAYFLFGNTINKISTNKIWEIQEVEGLKFNSLSKISLTENGDMYVLHSEGDLILKINNNGEKICEYKSPSFLFPTRKMIASKNGTIVVGDGHESVLIDSNCNESWKAGLAEDMVRDKDGNTYIAFGNKVMKSPSENNGVKNWSITLPVDDNSHSVSLAIDNKDKIYAFTMKGLHVINRDGKEESRFENIQGTKGVIDIQGNIIIGSTQGTYKEVIQKFNSKGEKLWDYNGPDESGNVRLIITDNNGNIYTTAGGGLNFCYGSCDQLVHQFNGSNGTLIKKYRPHARGCSGSVSDLAIDDKNNLYVVTCNAITKYKANN